MGSTESTGRNNDDFVDDLVETEVIKSSMIEKVFRAVDRADYFLEEDRENAYNNVYWKRGNIHLSAPYIYCEVIERLKLSPGLRFLNLGSGTGYFSTIVGLILGANGVNHGIEIYEDVFQYAIKKLNDFLESSAALDEYEFCVPRFIQGNCLTLSSTTLPYDRVFCGGACPMSYKTYVKNLVKVGGILIMPTDINVLQIKRTSETTWEETPFLSVVFPPLLAPTSNAVQTLNMEPLSLQEICRSKIRYLIRQNINDKDATTIQITPKRPKKKRCVIIPTFEESDLENSRELINILNEMSPHTTRNENCSNNNNEEPQERPAEISSLVRTGEKRIYIDTDSDSDMRDEDESSENLTRWVYTNPYTNLMRTNIQALPLPTVLKIYLNLNRQFN